MTEVRTDARSIFHVLAPAPFGGLETVVATLAGGQHRAGDDVTVVLVLSDGEEHHPMRDHPALEGVRIEEVHAPARGYMEERRKLQELIERAGCDVFHTHGYRPDVVDAPVARRLGVATVTTFHGFTARSLRGHLNEWLQRRAARRFDVVVAVSEPMRRQLAESGVPTDRLHAVPNAWEPSSPPLSRAEARTRLGLPAEGPVIGWVGRMSEEKAPDVMIEALAAIPEQRPTLSMIGDGDMRESLVERTPELGLQDHVVWHGSVPDAGRYLPAYDALLLTSWTEGTPMVVLEAMSAGVPIVTTEVGGIPDVLSPADALLVPAGDREAIAAAIMSVVRDDPDAASRRSESAGERLREEYSVDPWVERYSDLYDDCLRRGAHSG